LAECFFFHVAERPSRRTHGARHNCRYALDLKLRIEQYALMRGRLMIAVTLGCVAMTACGDSFKPSQPRTQPATTTTTTPEHPGRDALTFRLVTGAVPVGDPSLGGRSCETKDTTTAASKDSAEVVFLPDDIRKLCYSLGRVLLTGRDITGVDAEPPDQVEGKWSVTAHYPPHMFVEKIARPYVNQTIAIVFDGVVISAPTVNPGIVGDDVNLGYFDKDTAVALDRALS
jgi:hypothetical protein